MIGNAKKKTYSRIITMSSNAAYFFAFKLLLYCFNTIFFMILYCYITSLSILIINKYSV